MAAADLRAAAELVEASIAASPGRTSRLSTRLQSSSGTVCPIFFWVSFFGWTVDRTRVTARLLGLNGDSNGGNVRHRLIFCDFVSRCSVLLVILDVYLLICAFIICPFLSFFVDIIWVN